MFRWSFSRDPLLAEFDRLQRGIDDLFQTLATRRRPAGDPFWREARIFPLVNVRRVDNAYVVTAEIPGMEPEQLEIKVVGDTLALKGERTPDYLGATVGCHRRERAVGTFQRSLTLPTRVNPDEVEAGYVDGVLTIVLPMQKAAGPKQIPVTSA